MKRSTGSAGEVRRGEITGRPPTTFVISRKMTLLHRRNAARRRVRVQVLVTALLLASACLAPPVLAAGGGHSHHSGTTSSHTHIKAAPGVHRDSHGKIARSPQALQQFKKAHPCPATGKTYGACPGYVVDHVIPLKRGGADAPGNMQWQTKAAAKEKDRWE